MEQRIEVDWNKWQKNEWPKLPLFILCSATFCGLVAGFMANRVLFATIIGLIAGYSGSMVTKRFFYRNE